MSVYSINPIYARLQSGFQALVDAVERGENADSLQKKQNDIINMTNVARQLNLLDHERSESLKKLEQLDIQNKIVTLNQLLELQKKFNDDVVEELSKKVEAVGLNANLLENALKQKVDLLERENQVLRERLGRRLFLDSGIPFVEGQRIDWAADFDILSRMTAVSKRTICRFLGEMVEDVPPIRKECFDLLDQPDPFEPDKCIKDTFEILVVPPRVRRTREREWILDGNGNLITDPQKREKTLDIPLTLKNLRTLCSAPLAGRENMPVFYKTCNHPPNLGCQMEEEFEQALEQCQPATDRVCVYFTRKQVIGKNLSWDAQNFLIEIKKEMTSLEEIPLEVTSSLIRMWAHCFSILEFNTCLDNQEIYARTPDTVRYRNDNKHFYLGVGEFTPRRGVEVSGYDYGYASMYFGIAPGFSAEAR